MPRKTKKQRIFKKDEWRPQKDLTGLTIGNRTVLEYVGSDGQYRQRWRVRCSCGNIMICYSHNLYHNGACVKCAFKGPRPYLRKRPYEAQFNSLKSRARCEFKLTYEEFLEFTKHNKCHYCGAGIIWQEYRCSKKGGTGSNLDRKDSYGPYSKENVVVCCGRCNYGKNRYFTYDEWKQIGEVIRSWNQPNFPCHPLLPKRKAQAAKNNPSTNA